jgi:hypothetical protein
MDESGSAERREQLKADERSLVAAIENAKRRIAALEAEQQTVYRQLASLAAEKLLP